MEHLAGEIIKNISLQLDDLQWSYILSFILLCYGWQEVEKAVRWKWVDKIKKRFKVALIGIIYAPIHFILWELQKEQLGSLFISFLVSFTFHKLLIEVIILQTKAIILKLDFKQKGVPHE